MNNKKKLDRTAKTLVILWILSAIYGVLSPLLALFCRFTLHQDSILLGILGFFCMVLGLYAVIFMLVPASFIVHIVAFVFSIKDKKPSQSIITVCSLILNEVMLVGIFLIGMNIYDIPAW